MNRTTQAILDYNAGRDPARLRRKLALIAGDPFAFMRGTCHLFYAGLSALPAAPVLRAAPRVWICGDLHLENFGTFKGDNRLVYFDLNDFDETCLAPFTLDLVRLAASIKVAAQSLRLGAREGHALTALFFASYASEAAAGKARWIERSTAGGMVRDLLRSLKLRTRAQLLDQRTVLRAKRRALRLDGSKALPASTAQRKRAEALLADFAAKRRHPEFFEPMDIARRVAGNGALGLERYIALVRGRGGQSGGADGNFLIDIKCAAPSALKPHLTGPQHKWESEARRVVTIAKRDISEVAVSIWGPFAEFMQRRGALLVLTFILVHKIGDTLANLTFRLLFDDLGFTNDEIAEQTECVLRTVERKLQLIRTAWSKLLETD